MADSAKWYVVHTYSGYENKVATNLEKIVELRKMSDLIVEVKVPTEIEVDKENGKEYERKIFPGYVLIKMAMTDETWYIVRNIRGVTGFVGPGSKPIPLSDDEVNSLGMDKQAPAVDFAVGDSVKVTEGPLENFVGIVDVIDFEKNKVSVIVSMFGRETPVELEFDQVAIIE